MRSLVGAGQGPHADELLWQQLAACPPLPGGAVASVGTTRTLSPSRSLQSLHELPSSFPRVAAMPVATPVVGGSRVTTSTLTALAAQAVPASTGPRTPCRAPIHHVQRTPSSKTPPKLADCGASLASHGPSSMVALSCARAAVFEATAASIASSATTGPPPLVDALAAPQQQQQTIGGSSNSTQPATCSGETAPTGQQPTMSDREAVVTRFQDLLRAPAQMCADLNECFVAADVGHCNRLARDSALNVLAATFTTHAYDLPALSDARVPWHSLLRRFGVYNQDDSIGFDGLLDLYRQALEVTRDAATSQATLRDMQQVVRGAPRPNDGYDNFQFQAKDALGQTHRCRDRHTKEQRSCRQIRKDKASVPIDQIRVQLKSLQELDHPQIPRIVECLEDFHHFFVLSVPLEGSELMDYIQGSYVQSKGLTETWVASVIRQVLEAMTYCHTRQPRPVVHRDLRPSTVLISDPDKDGKSEANFSSRQAQYHRGQPRVMVPGFGLQDLFDRPRLQSLQPGLGMPPCAAPEFLAPEVWHDDSGPRCDIWACGCLMFLLLTGTSPFSVQLPLQQLLLAIDADEPDWRLFRHVSTSALSLCRRMLAKDDAARPNASECLRHPWFSSSAMIDRPPRSLRPETLSSLMQLHAQSKFLQVLMNIIATELQVCRLRRRRSGLAEIVGLQWPCGRANEEQFKAGLTSLGVSARSLEQVMQALGPHGAGDVPYGRFLAGCVDLVDDKLDHMLWKLFTMVDEDHSGEMSVVVFRHFLEVVCNDGDGSTGGDDGGVGSGGCGDVEQYLRGVLDEGTTVDDIIKASAGSSHTVTFEDIKRYIMEGSNGGSGDPSPGSIRPAACAHERVSLGSTSGHFKFER